MVGILFSYRGMPIFRGHVSFRRVNRKSKRMGVLGAGDFELLPGGNKVIDAIIHDESWWIIPIQYLILGGVPAWLFKGSNCIFTFGGQHAQQMKRQRNHQLQWKVRKVQSIKWKTTSLSCIPLVGASSCFFEVFFFPPRAAYKASKNSLPKCPFCWEKNHHGFVTTSKKVRSSAHEIGGLEWKGICTWALAWRWERSIQHLILTGRGVWYDDQSEETMEVHPKFAEVSLVLKLTSFQFWPRWFKDKHPEMSFFQFFTRIWQIVIRRKCKGDQKKLKRLLDACQKPLEAWSTRQKGWT